jgi:hypothetical protein
LKKNKKKKMWLSSRGDFGNLSRAKPTSVLLNMSPDDDDDGVAWDLAMNLGAARGTLSRLAVTCRELSLAGARAIAAGLGGAKLPPPPPDHEASPPPAIDFGPVAVREVMLRAVHVGDVGASEILGALARRTPVRRPQRVERDCVTFHFGPSTGVGPRTLETLREVLASPLCRLVAVELAQCHIGDDGIIEISDALAANRTLRKLGLSDNGITAQGVSVLARALETNCVLQSLDLSNNPLGPDGATALCESLIMASPRGRLLLPLFVPSSTLDSSRSPSPPSSSFPSSSPNNSASPPRCIDRANRDSPWNSRSRDRHEPSMIPSHSGSGLTVLSLSGCGIGDPGAIAMAAVLKANPIIRSVALFQNMISAPGVAALQEATRDASVSGFLAARVHVPLTAAQRDAFAMGAHPRWGAKSAVLRLPRNVVRRILSCTIAQGSRMVVQGLWLNVASATPRELDVFAAHTRVRQPRRARAKHGTSPSGGATSTSSTGIITTVQQPLRPSLDEGTMGGTIEEVDLPAETAPVDA